MKDLLLALSFVTFINALLAYAVYGAINRPVVQVSNSTGSCFLVQPNGDKQKIEEKADCEGLVSKHGREWIK